MLVTGPDWLTSVLAGMLGTNEWHVLAAQVVPTALLISGPVTAAGAFQLRVPEGGAWPSLSSLLLFFAAAVQVRGTRRVTGCWLMEKTDTRNGAQRVSA